MWLQTQYIVHSTKQCARMIESRIVARKLNISEREHSLSSYLSKTQSREEYFFFISFSRHQTIFMHPMDLDYLLSLRFLESRPLYKKAVKGTAGPKVELRGATPSFKKIVVEQKGTNMRLAAEQRPCLYHMKMHSMLFHLPCQRAGKDERESV